MQKVIKEKIKKRNLTSIEFNKKIKRNLNLANNLNEGLKVYEE